MKQKILTALLFVGITVSILVGCGDQATYNTTNMQTNEIEQSEGQETEEAEKTEETEETEDSIDSPTESVAFAPEEELHFHNYIEGITTEATCETDGTKAFSCECGDSYTETITAFGHIYENYVYNEDATYLYDGTEIATCNGCDLTDTRIASGTKLEYTFISFDKTMYAKQSVNVRDLPSTEGNKLGGLDIAQKVTVTGQCNETSWYRIEYDGREAFVSDKYLVGEKPVSEAETPAQTTTDNNSIANNSNKNNGASVTVPEKEESGGSLVWVPTNGGTKYHNKSSCSNMKNPMQVSVETAVANGYTPCKRCH